MEIYIHKSKNQNYPLNSGHMDLGKWENASIWEKHDSCESAEQSDLWNFQSDMSEPYYVDSDKYCPICTRGIKIVKIGEDVTTWDVKFCETCSNDIEHGDTFFIAQVFNRPIIGICRGLNPWQKDCQLFTDQKQKFGDLIHKLRARKTKKNAPLKVVEGDLVFLIKTDDNKEISELKKTYKENFKYVYSFPVGRNHVFLIRTNSRLNKEQKTFMDKTQYFKEKEVFEDGPMKGWAFEEKTINIFYKMERVRGD